MPKKVNFGAAEEKSFRHSYERKTKTPEQALRSLMHLCAKSEKSSGDALRLMRGWGVEPAAAQQVLATLIAQRFIDDSRYAAAYVREKVRLGGWGSFKIRAALAAKGISRETIAEALGQFDRQEVNSRLAEMLLRKRKAMKGVEGYELKNKLMRYGMGLGYEYEAVADAVERLMNNKD